MCRTNNRLCSWWIVAALAIVTASGCGNGSDDRTPVESGAVEVRMDFTRSGGLYDAPFPSADLQTDGKVDVSLFPNPKHLRLVDQVLSLISRDADGFALTGAIFFSLTDLIDRTRLPDIEATLQPSAQVFLLSVDDGRKVPVEIDFAEDGGPFGAPNLLSLLPVQGIPLRPHTRYAAVVCTGLLDSAGLGLRVSPAVKSLAANRIPEGLDEAAGRDYLDGYRAAARNCTVAGLAVFTTGAPADGLYKFTQDALRRPLPVPGSFIAEEVFDEYCVFSTTIDMPDYQQGVPPYGRSGGDWRVDSQGNPVPPHNVSAHLFVTIPRRPMPEDGYPTAIFVRAGGGGDRPLVDRGVHAVNGGLPISPGSGPAQEFARVGYAGVQVDGPLGGLRNVTHEDEQFLMFNVFNIAALRDNVRESALELSVLSAVLDDLEIDTHDCPGAPALARLDRQHRVLMGHSTGATIAPLAMAIEPSLRGVILSGAGGSYIENVLHKHKPLDVLPIANALVQYTDRTLTAHDPILTFVQWAAEPADPPIYADLVIRAPRYRGTPAHVLMLQGIVDNYILPNIANATSLSLGLDLAGDPLDNPATPGLEGQTPLLSVLPLSGRKHLPYPVTCNVQAGKDCVTAVVAQHAGDGIEDGHETVFQTEPPKRQYRCFLKSLLSGTPVVSSPETECD